MLSILSSAVLFSASSVLAAEVNLTAGNGDKGFTGSFEELKSDNESWYFLNGQTDSVFSTNSKSNNTLVFDGVDFYERGIEIWGGGAVIDTNYETAVENIVEVRNCKFDNGVSSVIIVGGNSSDKEVNNNSVKIYNSLFKGIGYVEISGASEGKNLIGNKVAIENSKFNKIISVTGANTLKGNVISCIEYPS